MKAFVTPAVVLVGLAAGPLLAQPARKDLQVSREVANQVNRYVNFTVFDDVNVEVEKGRVTLTGKVTMPHKRADIERRVLGVDGVEEVRNHLEVLPASISDDRLRYQLARAIYGHPTFWKYAAMSNPPIHIVVDRGRVTLTGIVSNDLERALARSIASTVFGTFGVDSQLRTDAEARHQLERAPARAN